MLSTQTTSINDKTVRDSDFNILDIKMEHSLDRLNYIKDVLTSKNRKQLPLIENERVIKLEKECLALKSRLSKLEEEQMENGSLLENYRRQIRNMQQKIDSLQDKYNVDYHSWQDKLSHSQEELETINSEYIGLQQLKKATETKWSRLQEAHKREVQHKEQLELLLKENAEELRVTTEAVLERDRKLDQYEQNALNTQHMMDEKDELLERYANEAETITKESQQLLDRVHQLEMENTDLQEQLEKPPAPVENEILDQQQLLSKQNISSSNFHDSPKSPFVKLESSKSTTRTSRIPVATHQKPAPQQDFSAETQQLKEELSLCNQKLMEKISQNKELESALERGHDHCEILRTSLNEAREESASRYRKMLDLMEENRILREAINTTGDR